MQRVRANVATYFCRTCGYVLGIEDGAVLKDCPRCDRPAHTAWALKRPEGRYEFSDADLRDLERIERWQGAKR